MGVSAAVCVMGCPRNSADDSAEHADNEACWLAGGGARWVGWPLDAEAAPSADLCPAVLSIRDNDRGGEPDPLLGVACAPCDPCRCTSCAKPFGDEAVARSRRDRGPFGDGVLLLTRSGNVLASGKTWDRLTGTRRTREEDDICGRRRSTAAGFRPVPSLSGLVIVQIACAGRCANAVSNGHANRSLRGNEREINTSYALFLTSAGRVWSSWLGTHMVTPSWPPRARPYVPARASRSSPLPMAARTSTPAPICCR